MKKILSLVLFLILAVPVLANATQCPTSNVVTDAKLFQWTDHGSYSSGTLVMGEATFNINGETLTTRAYAQEGQPFSIPGPTMVMEPGRKYVVRFKNLLPFEPLSTEHNTLKDPNVTNVHTHGLHISGVTPSDDVTRFFEGGYGGDFVYDIPSDHMGGSYWYHAHHHGSTFLQVSSGAFGMIVIDDKFDGIPPNVAAMQEQLLTIAYLDPSVAGTGGDTLVSGTLSPGWNVNGKVAGNVCLPSNTWQHWRMLIADSDAKSKDISIGSQCEVALMARDGVWRTTVPKNITNNTLTLTGASRADIAIRCSGDSTISVGNTVVANIFADGTLPADATVHPYAKDGVSQWASFRPGYLRDLRNEPVTNFEKVNMGARTINGNKFDIDVPTFTTLPDGVQEWNVKGATNHPFHLHVYHFQAQTDCGAYEAGEYYDTMAAACNVRFDLSPQTSTVYEGITILHCHILDHEDQGAMGWMDVLPAAGTISAPVFPTDVAYLDYYEVGGTEPPPPGTGTSLDVGSINVSTANVGKGQKIGIADIVVVDDLGNLVEGAIVSGEFSGDINEIISASPATDINGHTTVSTTQSAKVRSLTFCVTDIVDSNAVLDPFTGSVCGSL